MKEEFRLLDDRGRVFSADEADNDTFEPLDKWEESERAKRESSMPPPPEPPRPISAAPAPTPFTSYEPAPRAETPPPPPPAPPMPPAPAAEPPNPVADFNAWFDQRDQMLKGLQQHREKLLADLKLTEERLWMLGWAVDAPAPPSLQPSPLPPRAGRPRVHPDPWAGEVEVEVEEEEEIQPKPTSPRPPWPRNKPIGGAAPKNRPKAADKPAVPKPKPAAAKPAPAPAATTKPAPGSFAKKAGRAAPGATAERLLAHLSDKPRDVGYLAAKVGCSYQTAYSSITRAIARGENVVEISGIGRTKTYRRKT